MSLYSILEKFARSHSDDGLSHAFNEGLWIPAAAFIAAGGGAVVTEAEDQAGVPCVVVTASGAQTAILEAHIPLAGRVNAQGHGSIITDITIYYAVLTASLTSLTVLCKKVGWAAPNAVAAAPTLTVLPVTTTPVAATLTASAAQAFYALKCALAATNASQADAEGLTLSISPVLANTGVFKLTGAQVHYAAV